ncbi:MAG TPA: DUF748 domain-containing protein, partial [Ramlibacter sp.]|nr:DUF748 domain-containing protein [Ramlibacter sp.]
MRWVLAAAGALAAYAALGFWALPFAIERQLPRFVASELGRQASLSDVRFNPFTLRFEADQLRLAEAGGQPLFAVGKLAVQLQWRSLVRRAWTFAEVRLTEPQVDLLIAQDGRFNVAELVEAVTRRWPPDPASSPSPPPRVSIGLFTLERGRVQFQDRRAGYDNLLSPIDFTLTNFSTLPGETDSLSFSGQSPRGGKVRWTGETSLNPIRGSGELVLENVPLPELAVYLKTYARAGMAAGQLSTTLPYRFSYEGGKWEAFLAGGRIALRDIALVRAGASDAFASLTQLEVKDLDAAWGARQVSVGEVRAAGGKLAMLRDAQGKLDLGSLILATAGPAAAAGNAAAVVAAPWKIAVKQVVLDELAWIAVDETVQPALRVAAGKLRVHLKLAAQVGGPEVQLKLEDASATATDLTLSQGATTPLQLAEAGFEGGSIDLAAQKADFARLHARGGVLRVTRDREGRLNLADLLPKEGAPAAPAASGAPWTAAVRRLELSGLAADLQDEGSGVKLRVSDAAATVEGAGSDLQRPVVFDARLRMDDGGQLSAQGRVVPGTGAMQADVRVGQLALAPF